MDTKFLSNGYVAIALIKAKNEFFRENFITVSEFEKFNYFMQNEFNKHNLGIVIISDSLSKEDFIIVDNVIIPSNSCIYDLDRLLVDISNVLCDTSLMLKFFLKLENEKLQHLKNYEIINC